MKEIIIDDVFCPFDEDIAREIFNKMDKQLQRLKQENEELKEELHSKVEFIQEQRIEIDNNKKEIRMYRQCQGKRASKREEKYKQALEEIREAIGKKYGMADIIKIRTILDEVLNDRD